MLKYVSGLEFDLVQNDDARHLKFGDQRPEKRNATVVSPAITSARRSQLSLMEFVTSGTFAQI